MLNSLMFVTIVSIVMGVAYGYTHSTKGALLAFLASLLGFAIGGILGFLFGFPRYTDVATVQNPEDLRKVTASAGDGKQMLRASPIRHSTNLERITDWLMTMIVGATVINLKDLAGWAQTQFSVLGTAIVTSGDPKAVIDPSAVAAPGALLVLPFMVAGFLHLYLWARRYLPREWRQADDELYAQLAEQQQQTKQKLDELSQLFLTDESVITRFQDALRKLRADQTIVQDVVNRYQNAKAWNDDPMRGFATPETSGYRMSAVVTEEDEEQDNPYSVAITIERTDGSSFSGSVTMCYHNAFDFPIVTEPHQGKAYTDSIWCAGGFTVAAVLVIPAGDDGSPQTVKLAIDLESLPNLPVGFKATQ